MSDKCQMWCGVHEQILYKFEITVSILQVTELDQVLPFLLKTADNTTGLKSRHC